MNSRYIVVAVILFGTLHLNEVQAVLTSNTWAAGSGKWETAGNWSAGVPSITQSGNVITNATSKTVTIDASTPAGTLTISNLVIAGPAGTVNTLRLTNAPSSTLHILDSLLITNGGVLTISNSAVQVDESTGVPFILKGDVFLQSGSLVVTNSVSWIPDNGTASVTISNGTAQFGLLYLALLGGAGTMTVAGGTDQLFSSFNMGTQMEVTGVVWVTGGQLLVTNGSTSVGGAGYGQITVSNGAAFFNDVSLGNYPGASGELTVAGGTAQVASNLTVGADTNANGAVWVTGGQLTSGSETFSSIGLYGIGQMTVSNGTWQANNMIVGYWPGSQGTLTIAGGTNIFPSLLDIGAQAGATGTVWLTGGELIVTNFVVYVSEGGTGQLTISNGTFLAGALLFADPSSACGTLTVAGGTATILYGFDQHNGTQTVWLTGGQLTTPDGAVTIGELGVGRVTVSNGLWRARNVIMGSAPGSQGTLTVAGGVSSVYSNVSIGNTNCTASGFVFVTGGELHVTNDDATGVLEVRDGTLIQTGGLLDIDRLVITNPCAHFMHLGGTLIIGLETLSPNLDADGDGIPNGYELTNGLDPLNPGDASLDNDGDGMSNLQEYLTGTDPNNSASYFHITAAAKEGNNVRITWATEGGRTNQVMLNPPAANGGPTDGIVPLGPLFIIPGTGALTTNYLDVGGATNIPPRYYRVHQIP